MRAIHRKLLRDLRRHWVQVISIALVMACGTMTIMGLRSTLASVRKSQSEYYDRYRFADVFASVQRAPTSVAGAVAAIPGVAAFDLRIVKDVRLEVPGLREPAIGHVVSIPDTLRPILNQLHVRSGRWVAPGRDDEVLVSERFAEVNRLRVGDTLSAVLNGRWQRLRIVGIAISPEFVIETGSSIFVDSRRYGIIWAARQSLENVFSMKGAFNDVVIRLAPGARTVAVTTALDRVLAPYGSAGAYDRRDQSSARVLDNEFTQLRVTATIFPLFFLVVGAFLLNVVLSRLIGSQRDEIAALKAFGYTNGEVGLHYLGFALAAVVVGALLGFPAGMWMGSRFVSLYTSYFRFPVLRPIIDWSGVALAIGVSGGFGVLGAMSALRRVVSLPPAEALRPESPERFRPLLIERAGFGRLASPSVRMVLRNLERRPVRTLSGIVGIALAVALFAVGRYPYDAFDRMLDVHFRLAQRGDLTVQFTGERNAQAADELRHLPHVTAVEAFRSIPVRVRHGAIKRTMPLTSVDADATLRRIADVDGNVYVTPPAGALLTSRSARALGVNPGDTVWVEPLTRGGPARPLVVAALIDEMLGYGLYMQPAALARFLREDERFDGAYLSVQQNGEADVYAALEERPGVLGASSRAATIDNIKEQMQESTSFVLSLVTFSASLIAIGVVYNSARIALSERGRELATLRVLGFSVNEVAGMLLGEQGSVVLVAIPFGWLFGLGASLILARGMETEEYHFPFVANFGSYVMSALVVAGAAAVTSLFVRRRVARLDLVTALKTRE